MANKRVIVISSVLEYDKIMDETLVSSYITTAKTNGYFVDDNNEKYIPWENSSIKVQDVDDAYNPS